MEDPLRISRRYRSMLGPCAMRDARSRDQNATRRVGRVDGLILMSCSFHQWLPLTSCSISVINRGVFLYHSLLAAETRRALSHWDLSEIGALHVRHSQLGRPPTLISDPREGMAPLDDRFMMDMRSCLLLSDLGVTCFLVQRNKGQGASG